MEAPRKITRKRSRETGEERRRKDRERKRLKRSSAAAAPVVDNSSSSDEEIIQENSRIHHPEGYLFHTNEGAGTWRLPQVAGNRGETSSTAEGAASLISDEPEGDGSRDEQENLEGNQNNFPEVSVASPEHNNGEHASAYTAGTQAGASEENNERDNQSEGEHHGNVADSDDNRGHDNGDGAPGGEEAPEETMQGGGGEPPRNPGEIQVNLFDARERLAMALAGVRDSSEISDSAINKMLHVALAHGDTLRAMAEGRKTKKLYTKRLRPLVVKKIPRVFCALLLEEKVQGGLNYRRISDLTAIPKRYLKRQKRGRVRVIREESYVRLADIKEHHAKIHRANGHTEEEIRNHYGNAALSVDGVEEARSCKKTFHVVTLRLGTCIYLYKIFNPLVGHRVANPSVEEVLG